jgi:hypothetical protein
MMLELYLNILVTWQTDILEKPLHPSIEIEHKLKYLPLTCDTMNFKDLTIEYSPTIAKFLISITYNHPK